MYRRFIKKSNAVLLAVSLLTISSASASVSSSPYIKNGTRIDERSRAIQLAFLRQGMIEFRNVLDKSRNVPALVSMMVEIDPANTDLRGRTIADDFREYVLSRDELSQISSEMEAFDRALSFKDVDEGQAHAQQIFELISPLNMRRASILAYWDSVRDMQREQRMWTHSLQRNHLNSSLPHNKAVMNAEAHLRTVLVNDSPVADSWRDAMKDYITAMIDERNVLTRRIGGDKARISTFEFNRRRSACPATVMEKAGSKKLATAVISAPPVNASSGGVLSGIASISTRASIKGPIPDIDDYYPEGSKHDGEEGVVVLVMKVNSVGCPTDIAIGGSSGSDALDAAALNFSEKLTYNPSIEDGKPVATTVPLAVVFKLSERRDYAVKKESTAGK